jgi:hypothetical protein
MAFTISGETKIKLGGGEAGKALVYGHAVATAVTSGIVSGSTQHVRKIYAWGFTPCQNITTGAFNVVKTYDSATYDSDILTLTCTAGDAFDYWYIGEDNGDL